MTSTPEYYKSIHQTHAHTSSLSFYIYFSQVLFNNFSSKHHAMNSLEYIQKIGLGILLIVSCSSFVYRIIPVVTLNGQTSGSISSAEFSRYNNLAIDTLNHACIVSQYTLYHISLTKDVEVFKGAQATFSPPVQASIFRAEKGDKYIFINVMVQCKGDQMPLAVNPLSFNIK